MPSGAKTFLITTEKHELVIVRDGSYELRSGFCPDCGRDVMVLDFDAAIGFSGLSGRELVRLIEAGDVHLLEVPADRFGICRESLEMEKKKC